MKKIIFAFCFLISALALPARNVIIVNPTNKPVPIKVAGAGVALPTPTASPASSPTATAAATNTPTPTPTPSAFDPTTIAGLKGWWKMDSITGGAGSLATWHDSSGNGNDLVHGSFVAPDYQTAPAGAPWVQFDGFSQALVLSSFAGGPVSQPDTVFAVYDEGRVIDNTGPNRQIVGVIAASEFCAYAGATLDSGTGQTLFTFAVQTVIFNGSSSQIYVNGIARITGNTGTNSMGGMFMGYDGVSLYYSTRVKEILIYNSALSTTDRQNVEAYLRAKYATP